MSSRTLAHGIAKLLRATNYRSTGEANLANWNIPTIGFPFPEKSINLSLSNLDSSPTYIINNILACSPTFLPASKPWKKFPHESNYGGKTVEIPSRFLTSLAPRSCSTCQRLTSREAQSKEGKNGCEANFECSYWFPEAIVFLWILINLQRYASKRDNHHCVDRHTTRGKETEDSVCQWMGVVRCLTVLWNPGCG